MESQGQGQSKRMGDKRWRSRSTSAIILCCLSAATYPKEVFAILSAFCSEISPPVSCRLFNLLICSAGFPIRDQRCFQGTCEQMIGVEIYGLSWFMRQERRFEQRTAFSSIKPDKSVIFWAILLWVMMKPISEIGFWSKYSLTNCSMRCRTNALRVGFRSVKSIADEKSIITYRYRIIPCGVCEVPDSEWTLLIN